MKMNKILKRLEKIEERLLELENNTKNETYDEFMARVNQKLIDNTKRKIYEIEYEKYGNYTTYVVADNINQVFEWLENAKVEILSVEELGSCETIIKGDNNEN